MAFIAEGRDYWVSADGDGALVFECADESGRVVELTREDWKQRAGESGPMP